jgi:hypothetical protein
VQARRRGTAVRAVVTDAGSPVGGARVLLRGHSDRTNGRGVALLRAHGGGRLSVTAAGYTPARVTLR